MQSPRLRRLGEPRRDPPPGPGEVPVALSSAAAPAREITEPPACPFCVAATARNLDLIPGTVLFWCRECRCGALEGDETPDGRLSAHFSLLDDTAAGSLFGLFWCHRLNSPSRDPLAALRQRAEALPGAQAQSARLRGLAASDIDDGRWLILQTFEE